MPQSGRGVPRYLLLFAVWLGGLAALFVWTRPVWVHLFMVPMTAAAELVLRGLGLQAQLGAPDVVQGICILTVAGIAYIVTFECTGLFALLMCLAAVLAFPARWGMRGRGILMVVPAFFVYASLRIVVLGLVAHFTPQHIELFHLYVMVVANLGFVLALWLSWLQTYAHR